MPLNNNYTNTSEVITTMKKSAKKILLASLLAMSIATPTFASGTATYKVQAGDSLSKIAKQNHTTVANLKSLNGLKSNTIKTGQVLTLSKRAIKASSSIAVKGVSVYKVKSGDTLFIIAKNNGTTVANLKSLNSLKSDTIKMGQVLKIPAKAVSKPTPTTVIPVSSPVVTPTASSNRPTAVTESPTITYVVQYGDTASSIAKKFKTSAPDIMKYNYMNNSDWFSGGQTIAINGYALRDYAVVPGESNERTSYGTVVDWYKDGQYILKRKTNIQVTDVSTGLYFSAKVMGGFNHADIEPLTTDDTAIMQKIFTKWEWTPRPVSVYLNGMNIAGSLSGMPHSFDTTPSNSVSGHFDLYLKNSKPHDSKTSQTYIQQHYNNIPKASK
jgi:LysM repeat protein